MDDYAQTPEEMMQEAEEEAKTLVRNNLGEENLAPREDTGAASRDAGPPARWEEIRDLQIAVDMLAEIIEDPGDSGV